MIVLGGEDVDAGVLRICEVYMAVCGEGSEIGLPAVFVRTSGCNMRCAGWPCDTPYASVRPEGEMMAVEEVARRVLSYRCPRAFITGGEPLLWRTQVAELAERLSAAGVKVILQTNGSIYAPEVFRHCWMVSLDWKTPSSGERSDPDVIIQTVRTHPKVQVKFPIADALDLEFASRHSALLPDGAEIVVQPVNRVGQDDTTSLLVKLRWLVEEVQSRGLFRLRVLPQLHILIYGGGRGV
ncbi:MAG: 7-carboxy-7-deazaguanine synthase QueE [Armatimonadota bacterium]